MKKIRYDSVLLISSVRIKLQYAVNEKGYQWRIKIWKEWIFSFPY